MGITIIDTLEIKNDVDVPVAEGEKISGVLVTLVTSTPHTIASTNVERHDINVRTSTIAAASTVNIPASFFTSKVGMVIDITDADQNAQAYPITIDPGAGKTINGETTAIINGNGDSLTLKIISSTEMVAK
jgi:hypothetical protein